MNIYDEIEYIKRSVSAIESIVECSVPAIAISPMIFKTPWNQMNNRKSIASIEELDFFRNMVEEQLNVKAYIIGTKEIRELASLCVDFLSQD